MLSTKAISYSTGETTLLSGLEMDASGGELVGVIGPNGAGKSTCLRLLSGDITPTEGTVSLDGRRLEDYSPTELAARRSFLGQKPQLDLDFTAAEIVAMGRHPHRLDSTNSANQDRSVVEDAMGQVGVGHLADRRVSTLSGGEQQRVSLARVIAQDADLVLMDEPTTFTDVAHAELILAQARRMARGGACVIAVLHDLNLAAAHADRILLLNQGRTVACGAPREVLTEPLLTEVYGLPMRVIDHPFMNCPLVLADPASNP